MGISLLVVEENKAQAYVSQKLEHGSDPAGILSNMARLCCYVCWEKEIQKGRGECRS